MAFKKVLAAGLIGTSVVGGAVAVDIVKYNGQHLENAWTAVESLSSQIEAFANNETSLIGKYNELHKAAAELQAENENLTATNEELTEANTALTGEVNKANTETAAFATAVIAESVRMGQTHVPIDADTLPGLGQQQQELFSSKVVFNADGTAYTYITLNEDINIGLGKKGNVSIHITDINGKEMMKQKTYGGYLNDKDGNKYSGLSNSQLTKDMQYTNVYTVQNQQENGMGAAAKITVKVTNDNGVVQTQTFTR